MKWLVPKSLSSQIALVMTAALLVASAVNFGFLWAERSRAGLIEATGPGLARFVDFAQELAATPVPASDRPIQIGRQPGAGRFVLARNSMVAARGLDRSSRLEQRLYKALQDSGVKVKAVNASDRIVTRPDRPRMMVPPPGDFGPGGQAPPRPFDFQPPPGGLGMPGDQRPPQNPLPPSAQANGGGPQVVERLRPPLNIPDGGRNIRAREVILSAQLEDGRWLNANFFSPLPPSGEIFRLGASTFVLFACVLIAALWIARVLSRPLNDLTQAASHVGAAGEPQEVIVRGPSDVRQTLTAFNAMSQRVSQLLGEKDVMLGALGHDLRTPLASLRIRLETMEPESERLKAVKTIEETTLLLEAILELARQGRSTEPVQTMDVSILIQDIVEDYTETGANVELVKFERSPAAIRPLLFKRLLRNLIDNALTYGGVARVHVGKVAGHVEIRVEDDGPGMSPEALANATRPFVRGDVSRNRGTGGAGLGLALADAIAKTHKGALALSNRSPRGLSAAVTLPLLPV